MIHLLEENNVKPEDGSYYKCYIESIKCHHDDIAIYIANNYLDDESETNDINIFLKYYNFSLIDLDIKDINSLFLASIKYGYNTLLKIILERTDVDVNYFIDDDDEPENLIQKTPLIFAIEKENIGIIQLLLRNEKIDVNMPKKYSYSEEYKESYSPLVIAINKNNIKIVQLLLQHPNINTNSKSKMKDTENDDLQIKPALIIAVEQNNQKIVDLLLKSPNIDVNAMSKTKHPYKSLYDEKTALCIALEKGNIEIIKSILESNYLDINSYQYISVDYPYDEFDDPTIKTTKTALTIAIEENNEYAVKLLLSCSKLDINEQKTKIYKYMSKMSSFTEYKCGGGWSYIMPLIRDVISDPHCNFAKMSTKSVPALCLAIKKKLYNIVKILLSSGNADVNSKICEKLSFFNKTDNNSPTDFNWSPKAKIITPALCIAVMNNDVETVKLLLSSQTIDVNVQYVKESYQFTEKGEEEDSEYDDDTESNWVLESQNESPLHIAVEENNEEIIRMLLQDCNIDLNAVDENGKKAIDYAENS